jgi:hypothetical protein
VNNASGVYVAANGVVTAAHPTSALKLQVINGTSESVVGYFVSQGS